MTAGDILNYFSKIGEVRNAYLIFDPITKLSKGFGYVEFETVESAEKALSLQAHQLLGKNISVQRQRNGLKQSKILQREFLDSSHKHKHKHKHTGYYPKTKEYPYPVSSKYEPLTKYANHKESLCDLPIASSREMDPLLQSGKFEPSTRSTFETRRNLPNQSSCSISFIPSSNLLVEQEKNLHSVNLLGGRGLATASKYTSSRKEFYRHLKLLNPIPSEPVDDSNYTYVIESALSTALRRRRLVNYLHVASKAADQGYSFAGAPK